MCRNALAFILIKYIVVNMKTLNLTKLAEYLGRPKRTLYEMIKDGRFPVEPIRGTKPRLWNVEHVNAWLNNN